MKRVDAKTLNPNNVKPHYTYFKWKNCQKCGLDFRRENGVSWYWFQVKEMYLCQDCSYNGSVQWSNEYVQWLYDVNHFKRPPRGR